MGSLFNVQKDVQSIAEVIASALKVETEIVDDKGMILGATGRIRGQLLTKRTDIFINRYVLDKKIPFILESPGKHRLCEPCMEKNECFYTAGIYYPINLNDTCYGAISLISFDDQQKEILMANQSSFMDFIGKMADLLAIKILEFSMMDRLSRTNEHLEAIVNSVTEGIISCDEDGIISFFNNTASELLGVSKKEVSGKHVSTFLPNSLISNCLSKKESLYEKKMVYTSSNGENITLISNATLVKSGDKIIGAVESFSEEEKLFRVAYRLSNSVNTTPLEQIIGESNIMRKLKRDVIKIASGSSTVLITGESGTGKELFARAIHSASPRSKEPFVAINCSAIPDTLLESELFGYEKGAFTGANTLGKIGKFELANEGTIFLDEIGDMPLHLQAKLLRVIQERTIQRVGGNKDIRVNVRIIAATHQNLKEMTNKKQFREDLYYRLNVIPLFIPSLRERPEDILLTINYMQMKYANLLNKRIAGISEEALDILKNYKWPGNIRELENAIEYATNFCPDDNIVHIDYLPDWLSSQDHEESPYKQQLQKTEKQILQEAIQTMGNSLEAKDRIANMLGISISTLYRKLRKYDLLG